MTGKRESSAARHDHHLRWLADLPPGWHALYRAFAQRLVAEHPDVEVTHAGAKLASLQVLTRGGDGTHRQLVQDAAKASASTCELCGRAGRALVDEGGWCRALCADHSDGFSVWTGRERNL